VKVPGKKFRRQSDQEWQGRWWMQCTVGGGRKRGSVLFAGRGADYATCGVQKI
jgi:hypothetical protein